MKHNKGTILRSIEQPYLKDNVPEFDTGDTVRVDYRVSEGNRTRVQAFEGVVIARSNGKTGARSTFTVRKISFGTGVERIFPIHSPLISGITVVRRGRTRRAKLYYLRDLRGKAARLKTDVARQEVDRVAFREARDARVKADQERQVQQEAEAKQRAEEEAKAQAAAEAATAEAEQADAAATSAELEPAPTGAEAEAAGVSEAIAEADEEVREQN